MYSLSRVMTEYVDYHKESMELSHRLMAGNMTGNDSVGNNM